MTDELITEIYASNGRIDTSGFDGSDKGLIYFVTNCDDHCIGSRGKSSSLTREFASFLGGSLQKKSGIKVVRCKFPDQPSSFPLFLDGYWGRPQIGVGAIFLKPLPQRRISALARELGKIEYVEDRWGRKIKIIIENDTIE